MLGVIGMILAIVVMIWLAYKGLAAIPLTLLATLIVILTNGLPIWESYAQTYAGGFAGVVQSYFFIFVSSSIYAQLMEASGATLAIGYKFIDWFGKKRAMLVTALFTSVLTYGGVSLFVVVFAVAPIAFLLFKEAGLPRHLTAAALFMGSATYTMTCLPGSPQLTNVIPSQYLGTPMTAAPILSIILAILMFLMNWWYINYAEKKARAAGETWSFPDNYNEAAFQVRDRSELPSAITSFLPIIVLIVIIVGASQMKLSIASDSALLTTIAMIAAFLVCLIGNWKHLKGKSIKNVLGTGSVNAINAMIGLAAVVAFGGVVSSSPAFQDVVKWVIGVNLSPYFKGVFATGVIAGITGSSSGGVRICLQNMTEYFMGTGCNLEVLHRLMSVAAGSLDTLPHVSGIFLMFSVLGLTHKDAYKHVFVISVVEPLILAVVFAGICTVIF